MKNKMTERKRQEILEEKLRQKYEDGYDDGWERGMSCNTNFIESLKGLTIGFGIISVITWIFFFYFHMIGGTLDTFMAVFGG